MDIDQSNRWLTFLANIGVIIGLIFLALEIQQSNRIAIAATEIDVRASFSALNESIYSDPNLAKLLVRLADANAEVAPDEDIRIYGFILQQLNTYMAVETAYDNGLVPPATFEAMESDLRGMMINLPAVLTYYRRAYDTYPEPNQTKVFQTVGKLLSELEDS